MRFFPILSRSIVIVSSTRAAWPASLIVASQLVACGGGADPATSGAGGNSSASTATTTVVGAGGSGGAATASTSASGSGGSGAGGAAPINEVVSLAVEACTKSPPSASRCERYDVTCGGAATTAVELAFYDPPAGTPRKGIIVFGSGGDGTGYYNFTKRAELTAAGFTVIDRRWPTGWFGGATEGPGQASCRLAAVLRHLRKSLPADGLLCATGNSGGSAELGFALTWRSAGAVLDFAMPTSGPFHRLDLACQGEADATWPATCAALKASACPDCASTGCQLGNGPRSLVDASFGGTPRCSATVGGDLAMLEARSPIHGPSAATLDGAPVHVLIGKDDPGAYAPLATALTDALAATGANVSIDYVTGAPHEMDTTTPGAIAIRDALLTRCVATP